MTVIQEIFLETDWDDINQARTARDQRAAQLQAQGLVCSYETLYRIHDGHRVFLLEAKPPESIESADHPPKRRIGTPRPKLGDRSSRRVEHR